MFSAFSFFGLAVLANFTAKRGRNGSKKQKAYFINVSWTLIWQPLTAWEAPFCQKKPTLLYLNIHINKFSSVMDPDP
jgi:hypothetical protein